MGRSRQIKPWFPAVDAAIKQKGTVKQFIEQTGVNVQTYYAMQARRTTPTLGLIYKILRYTGLTFEEAFGSGGNNAQ